MGFKKLAALCAVLGGVLAAPAIASAGTVFVSHAGVSGAAGKSCATAAFSTVQSAVNAAKSGDQVYLCSNAPYLESVVIQNKNVNLLGDPGATIQAPANSRVPTTFFAAQNLQDPNSVLTLIGNVNVQVTGLTIEGPFVETSCGYPTPPGQTDDEFGVLAIAGANVQLNNDNVLNIGPSNPALEGCQFGVAVQIGREYWPNTTGANGGYDLKNFVGQTHVQNTNVSGYAKNGITVDGPGSQAQIEHSTVDGGGQTAQVARNGVQISRGASAQVQNNSINNNEYTGPGSFASATGVLVFAGCGDPLSLNVQVQNNTLTNNDAGVDVFDADPSCSTAPSTQTNNQVHDNVIAKNDGVTNVSPYTDEFGTPYTGYQVGVADTGNNDQVHDNRITSTTGAFGPLVTPGGPFLAPIDIQTYPPIHVQVHDNKYNGIATNPPY